MGASLGRENVHVNALKPATGGGGATRRSLHGMKDVQAQGITPRFEAPPGSKANA